MWRISILIAVLGIVVTAELDSQMIRREGTITLPPGTSISTGFFPRAATISRSGDRIAAMLSDNTVGVWEVPSGKLEKAFKIGQPAKALGFSDDGELLGIADQSGMVNVWDTRSWRLVQKLSSALPVYVLAISADHNLLAGANLLDNQVQVWSLTTGQHLLTVRPSFGNSMAASFSPDSLLLATADADAAIRIYDARTGGLRSTVTELLLEAFGLAFSPDGRSLLIGGVDRKISVIDTTTGKISRVLPRQAGVLNFIVISADGKRAGSLHYPVNRFDRLCEAVLWDLTTGSVLARLDEPEDHITPAAAFLRNRLLLATVHANELRIWSLE
jgi:WD40 repeat protein